MELLDLNYKLIRVEPGGKAAIDKAWQLREISRDQILEWIKRGGNIGIPTGKANDIVVFDCDSPKADEWVHRNLPESPMVQQTPRGGFHYFYRRPDVPRIGNRVNVLQLGLDIRADLAYVVGAGSFHNQLGTHWRFVRGPTPASQLPTFDLSIVPVPPPCKIEGFREDDPSRRIIRAHAYSRRIMSIQGEGGSNALFRLCCKCRDFGLSRTEALGLLIGWNQSNAKPPWSVPALEKKLRDAYAKGQP